ncbi:hypothetical protein C8J57DRAFT_1227721 [Mycena rebaudengoi]|nr:hypothetical protein C8J57DRAFT_1227721 [Mycena rebaudengoi]
MSFILYILSLYQIVLVVLIELESSSSAVIGSQLHQTENWTWCMVHADAQCYPTLHLKQAAWDRILVPEIAQKVILLAQLDNARLANKSCTKATGSATAALEPLSHLSR